MKAETWRKKRDYTEVELALARAILEDLLQGVDLNTAQRAHPKPDGGGFIPKHALVAVYTQLVESGVWEEDEVLLSKIRMKPTRTLSGVTTVTVLTRYHPCPGECIFCPQEEQLPKSYLSEEPGAKRGLENLFDPYAQVHNRIKALKAVGHPTDKIELLILGGSFSAYPRDYQGCRIEQIPLRNGQYQGPVFMGARHPCAGSHRQIDGPGENGGLTRSQP